MNPGREQVERVVVQERIVEVPTEKVRSYMSRLYVPLIYVPLISPASVSHLQVLLQGNELRVCGSRMRFLYEVLVCVSCSCSWDVRLRSAPRIAATRAARALRRVATSLELQRCTGSCCDVAAYM